MTTRIHIDFETRSTVNLKQVGVYAYAQHPDTEIQCMAWAVDDDDVGLWVPGDPYPDLPDGEYWAHNANFERIIWREVGYFHDFPLLELEDWYCSAAQCAAMGLPRSLDHAAVALGLDYQKDKAGHALMLQMTRPRSPGVWWDDNDRLQRLYEYCRQDVRVEREIETFTRRLDKEERETYLLDQRMNDRGIAVDLSLVDRAQSMSEDGILRANLSISRATNYDIRSVTSVSRINKWLNEQGIELPGLTKTDVTEALERTDLSSDVRAVLEARLNARHSSVSKLKKMRSGALDGRLQGLLSYHGAHTGRWAGRRVQPQNFPRTSLDDPDTYIKQLMAGERDEDMMDDSIPMVATISSLLRSMLIAAPGHRLMVGDYSAIEAIVIAWLAGQDDLVARFAARENVYLVEGQTVGATRQHGKAIILGCGFGMGAKRFVTNSKDVFDIDVSFVQAEQFVKGYRKRYPKIPAFWYALQNAFCAAMDSPLRTYMAGDHIKIVRKGRYIWMILPSGRPLCYTQPRFEGERDFSIMRVDLSGKMVRRRIWGGVLAENVTQAVARDVMVGGLKNLETAEYSPVFTVHDEIICEVPDDYGTLDNFLDTMSAVPSWAPGLPVIAEGFETQRYRKG